MGVNRNVLKAVADQTTEDLSKVISEKMARHGEGSSRGVPRPPEQAPVPAPAGRISRLFEMISLRDSTQRRTLCKEIMERVRKKLPAVFEERRLKAKHFGFKRLEDFVRYLEEALYDMETRTASAADFVRGIKGWRWNFAGRVIFERLIKYNAKLDAYFREAAKEFFSVINAELRTAPLVDAFDRPRKVASKFGRPLKVLEFRLVGDDSVTRAFTDFGFIAKNRENLWGVMPIELKLPGALGGVAEQFGAFGPRVAKARKIIAIVEKAEAPIEIEPSALVFMKHDRGHLAVAPASVKRLRELLGARSQSGGSSSVPPGEIASVTDVGMSASATHGTFHYRVRVLIATEWLEAIVRLITDP